MDSAGGCHTCTTFVLQVWHPRIAGIPEMHFSPKTRVTQIRCATKAKLRQTTSFSHQGESEEKAGSVACEPTWKKSEPTSKKIRACLVGLSGAGDASQIPGMWAQMAARTRAKGWAMLHRFPECGIKPRKVEGSLIHRGGGLGRYKGVTKHATPPPYCPARC